MNTISQIKTEAARIARKTGNRLFYFVRVRLTRKVWTTYRYRNHDIVSRPLALLLSVLFSPAFANPTGGTVTSGSAVISTPSANNTTITQSTNRVGIDWQSFSINTNQSVVFVQPSATSIALNRIVGNDPSGIYGSLKANGQVYLLNSNGVYFSPTARVDTAALLATTLSMSNDDFMAGRLLLTAPAGSGLGEVVNQGTIVAAPYGYVILAGNRVSNEGQISAPGGTVGLAAGSRVVIDPQGDGVVKFSVDAGALGAIVKNSGDISADGGSVALTANSLDGALSTVVNQTGVIRANSVGKEGGLITLRAIGGDAVVTGSISATGTGAGQTGGTVQVLGDRVGLFGNAAIDASGAAGGGTVLVGGDLHGQGGVPTANATVVGTNATIKANALDSGNGGKVVVWADGNTSFNGSIEARGGANGGDGGFVEVSGKQNLGFHGVVNTLAPLGKTGTLLLDPADLQIVALDPGWTTGVGTSADPFLPDGAGASELGWNRIDTQLGLSNVVATTVGAPAVAGENGDITFLASSPVGFNRANSLTFTADRNITFSGGLSVANAGSGDLIFNATGAGAIQLNNATLSTGGAIQLNSATSVNASGGITTGTLLTVNAASGSSTLSGVIGGAGGLTKSGAGTVSLQNNMTYSGPTTVNSGNLNLNGSVNTAGTLAVAGGTFDLQGNSQTFAGVQQTGGTVQNGTLTLNAGNYDLQTGTISAVLAGTAGASKTTGGTTTLSGTNTYTGATSVTAGTLALGASNVIADTSAVTVNGATAILDIGVNNDTVASVALQGAGTITGTTGVLTSTAAYDLQSGTVSAILGGAAGANKTTGGAVTLSKTNTYTGTTAVNSGQLTLSGGAAIKDTEAVTVASGATLSVGADETVGSLVSGGTISGAGKLTAATYGFTGGTITSNLGAGTLTQTSGSTALNGTTDATIVNVNGGTLTLGSSNRMTATPALTVAGGTLAMGAASESVASAKLTSGSITGTTGVLTSTAAYDMQGGSVSAILAGTAGLNATVGTTVLSGANTYTGTTAVNSVVPV